MGLEKSIQKKILKEKNKYRKKDKTQKEMIGVITYYICNNKCHSIFGTNKVTHTGYHTFYIIHSISYILYKISSLKVAM